MTQIAEAGPHKITRKNIQNIKKVLEKALTQERKPQPTVRLEQEKKLLLKELRLVKNAPGQSNPFYYLQNIKPVPFNDSKRQQDFRKAVLSLKNYKGGSVPEDYGQYLRYLGGRITALES